MSAVDLNELADRIELIASIGYGSATLNSLPHIAKLADEAASDLRAALAALTQPKDSEVWEAFHALDHVTFGPDMRSAKEVLRAALSLPRQSEAAPRAWLVVSEKAGDVSANLSEVSADADVANVVKEYGDAYGKTSKLPLYTTPQPAQWNSGLPGIFEKATMDVPGKTATGAAQADTTAGAHWAGDGLYYIQDTRGYVGNCVQWWGPERAGYTTRLDEAGRYPKDEALRQAASRSTDVAWPCDVIDKLARPTIDMQDLRQAASAPGGCDE